jgi:hypothetical protein
MKRVCFLAILISPEKLKLSQTKTFAPATMLARTVNRRACSIVNKTLKRAPTTTLGLWIAASENLPPQ